MPGLKAINFAKEKVYDTLMAATDNHGPDVAIEAVGFHYCKSWLHTVEMALMLETDPAEILNELITCVRKVRSQCYNYLLMAWGRLSLNKPGFVCVFHFKAGINLNRS